MNSKGIYQNVTGILTGGMNRDDDYSVTSSKDISLDDMIDEMNQKEKQPVIININFNVSLLDTDKLITAIKEHLK